jgi:hypothetical protein
MNRIDKLIENARHSGQLMAEDKASGVRVLVKLTQYGWRVQCFIHGEREHYDKCKKLLEKFDKQMGGNHEL